MSDQPVAVLKPAAQVSVKQAIGFVRAALAAK